MYFCPIIINYKPKIKVMNPAKYTTKWTIDAAHSEIVFKVKHLMITNVKGEFRKFDAEIHSIGEDFSDAKIKASIDASSVFTNNTDRDNHLKSADFFNSEEYGRLNFESTEVKRISSEKYQLTGNLEIKDKTNLVTLNVEFGGTMKDPYGNEKAGFSLSGKINRKDWGLNWNATLEAGGVMVSDDVRIMIEAQFIKS